jgi:hypothetical protein
LHGKGHGQGGQGVGINPQLRDKPFPLHWSDELWAMMPAEKERYIMKLQLKSRFGKLAITADCEIADGDVAKVLERSASLALQAAFCSKAAGGAVKDRDAITAEALQARWDKRESKTSDCVFSNLAISAWTPSVSAMTPEGIAAAVKSGKIDKASLEAALAAMEA